MIIKSYCKSIEINHNPNWPYIPDRPYKVLITGGSGLGKTNVLLNLIKHHWPDINKIYLYMWDLYETYMKFIWNLCEIYICEISIRINVPMNGREK